MIRPIHYGTPSLKVSVRPTLPKRGPTTSISSEWMQSQLPQTTGNSLGAFPTSIHGATRENFGSILKTVKPLNTAP